MIDSSRAVIEKVVVHNIGSLFEGETVSCSNEPVNLTDNEAIGVVLKAYFFNLFKSESYFNFIGAEEGAPGMVCKLAGEVFDEPSNFFNASIQLARFLYQAGNLPKVKGGDFYMALFRDCLVDGELVDGLGLFKAETKETFLQCRVEGQSIVLDAQEGVNIRKVDKGCVIFNTEREIGYKVVMVDSGKGDARYWQEDFLALQPREDSYYFTKNYLSLCTSFVKEVYNNESQVEKRDQLDFMNRSLDFFDSRGTFHQEDFERDVVRSPDTIRAFNDYKSQFEDDAGVIVMDSFDISKPAVKSGKKFFKSILKLDKNFHVYVHGKGELIEKGFDPVKKMNFYKLFFEQEL